MALGINVATRDRVRGHAHTEAHEVVKPVRFKVANRKTITTTEQLDAAIQELVTSTGYTEYELRIALYDHMTGQYPQSEFARNRTEALNVALTRPTPPASAGN